MRLINKITIVILTILVVQIPIPVLADTAVTSYVQFENGGLEMAVDDIDFGTLDTSNLTENDNQAFLQGMGHILLYGGSGKLTVTDNRLDSNAGYQVTVKTGDNNWYDDQDEQACSMSDISLLQMTGSSLDLMSPDIAYPAMNVAESPLAHVETAGLNKDAPISYAIFVPATSNVSNLLGKTIHIDMVWTLGDYVTAE